MSQSNRLEPVNEVSPAGPAPYPLNLFMNCFWNSEYFHASVAYLAHLEFRVNRWYVSCRLFILKNKLFSPAFNFFDQISSRANKKKVKFWVDSLLNGHYRAIFTCQNFELFFSIWFKSETLFSKTPLWSLGLPGWCWVARISHFA